MQNLDITTGRAEFKTGGNAYDRLGTPYMVAIYVRKAAEQPSSNEM